MKLLFALAAAAPIVAMQGMADKAPQHDDLSGKAPTNEASCTAKIQQVRAAQGMPKLDRGNAKPDEAMLYEAVDHRIDGCSVLVLKNAAHEIRPVPDTSDRAPRFIPMRPN